MRSWAGYVVLAVILIVLANALAAHLDRYRGGRLAGAIFAVVPPADTGPIKANRELLEVLSPEARQRLFGGRVVEVLRMGYSPDLSGSLLAFSSAHWGPVYHVLYTSMGGPRGLVQGSAWYAYLFGYWYALVPGRNLDGGQGPRNTRDLAPPAEPRQDPAALVPQRLPDRGQGPHQRRDLAPSGEPQRNPAGEFVWSLPQGWTLRLHPLQDTESDYDRLEFLHRDQASYRTPVGWIIALPMWHEGFPVPGRSLAQEAYPWVQVGGAGEVFVYLSIAIPGDNATGMPKTPLLTEFRLQDDAVTVRRLHFLQGLGDFDDDGRLEVLFILRWPHTICNNNPGKPYQPHPVFEFGPDGLRPDEATTRKMTRIAEGLWEGDEPSCLRR